MAKSYEPPDPLIDSPMLHDPELPEVKPEIIWDTRMRSLWVWGLDQPDADTVHRTADAIGEAAEKFPKDVADFAPKLISVLDKPGVNMIVRLAAARALIRLDAKSAAASLLQHNQSDGPDMILLTDPALAAWKYEPAEAVWLQRVTDTGGDRAVRLSAIEALQISGLAAAGQLSGVVTDSSTDVGLRLAAAKALGSQVASGLEPLAENFSSPDNFGKPLAQFDHLMAVSLLAKHSDPAAQAILLRLADDPEPAGAAAAIRRLFEIDPMLVDPVAEKQLVNDDTSVRQITVEAALAWKSARGVTLAAPLLDDPDPKIRRHVRDRLIELDKESSLSDTVRDAATKVLSGDSWRGKEQAALVLGKIGHKPAAPRLLELIDDQRPEVRLAAVAALRWLALPETLEPLLAHAQDLTDRKDSLVAAQGAASEKAKAIKDKVKASRGPLRDTPPEPIDVRLVLRASSDIDLEMSQLFQMFGIMGYQPAEPLLRRYVPKHSFPWTDSRGAAVWSLGWLLQGKEDPQLVTTLIQRMNDNALMDPEAGIVRRMSAITLARLQAQAAVGSVRGIYASNLNAMDLRVAGRWALMELTGENVPPLQMDPSPVTNGFLLPTR